MIFIRQLTKTHIIQKTWSFLKKVYISFSFFKSQFYHLLYLGCELMVPKMSMVLKVRLIFFIEQF